MVDTINAGTQELMAFMVACAVHTINAETIMLVMDLALWKVLVFVIHGIPE